MVDLGASINVMPTSIYKSLNFGDLEPTGMTIQLANRSVVQPLGVLENVLVQVNELIFPTDFSVLDMEDETSGKGSTLILGRPFLMTAKTKINVHVGKLSMEFGDTLVHLNIFEAMKHPTEDHSLFGIDLINELVEEYFQVGSNRSLTEESNYDEVREVHNLSDSEDDNIDLADLSQEVELIKLLDQVCKYENPKCSNKKVQVAETKKPFTAQVATMFTSKYELAKGSRDQERMKSSRPKRQVSRLTRMNMCKPRPSRPKKTRSKQEPSLSRPIKARIAFHPDPTLVQNKEPTRRSRPQQPRAKIISAHQVPNPTQVGQSDQKVSIDNSSSPPPPMELKPLPGHLKYAYFDAEQQLPVIISSNLCREQEDKLLNVLRQHKKAIGWKLSDLLGINPSICIHRILMKEESKPIRQQ
ncbi:hypothetical protein CR513_18965, partial [Mucuna pruriens]